MRSFNILIYLMLISLALVAGAERASAYGGRSVGLGMAYCALSDDANGVFFNPAGLARVPEGKRYISCMIKANDRDKETIDSFAVSGQILREERRIKFSIQEYLEQDFKPDLHEKKLYFNYALGALFAEIDTLDEFYKMSGGYFGFGRKIMSEPKISVGGKLISTSHTTNEQKGTMTTLGLGLQYEYNDIVNIGLMADDLFSDGPFISPIIVSLGFLINVNDSTRIVIDGYNLTSENTSWRWRGDGSAEFRAGLEKTFLNDTFIARIGSKNGNLNMGFAVEVTPNFLFEYAFNYDNKTGWTAEPQEQQHFLSSRIIF